MVSVIQDEAAADYKNVNKIKKNSCINYFRIFLKKSNTGKNTDSIVYLSERDVIIFTALRLRWDPETSEPVAAG